MEHLSLQIKFLSFIQSNLDLFKQRSVTLWNFRCPYCGDSQKSTQRARGYLYKNKKGLISYQCHNCGENHGFRNFLKFVSPHFYNEYVLETFGTQKTYRDPEPQVEISKDHTNFTPEKWGLVKASQLSRLHLANRYLRERKVPNLDEFYYTENYQSVIDSMGLQHQVPEDPRLILFETDRFGSPKLMIARSVITKDPALRYVEIKVDESYPKMYGLGRLDYSKPIIIVEGAIDSLFIENSIAALDANLTKYHSYDLGISKPTLVWDNEPRSFNTVQYMKKAIQSGEKVCIFPQDLNCKDINDMVKKGIDVPKLIQQRTFSGVQAMIEFQSWKRTHDKRKRYYRY